MLFAVALNWKTKSFVKTDETAEQRIISNFINMLPLSPLCIHYTRIEEGQDDDIQKTVDESCIKCLQRTYLENLLCLYN